MFEEIRNIIADQLGIDAETITETTLIAEDLGADSLDVVEILMAIEEKTGISISDEEVANMKTIRDIMEYPGKNK